MKVRRIASSQWSWILYRAEGGALILDVVMNLSGASWSRAVELTPDVRVTDTARLDAIARAVSYSPRRTDVADVDGALHLLQASTRLVDEPEEQAATQPSGNPET